MSVADLLNSARALGAKFWFEGERLRFRAPADALDSDHRAQLSAHRKEIIAQLRAEAAREQKTVSASLNQRALWILHQQSPGSFAYHVAMPVRVLCEIDIVALRNALQALVDRHSPLRTTYDVVDGALCQSVAGTSVVSFDVHQVLEISEEKLSELVKADYEQPFDLKVGPIIRCALYSRGPKDHVLLLTIHHIAVDGWSLALLVDELFKLYGERVKNVPANLPRPELQYTDYVTWQENMLAGSEGDRLWKYWQARMAPPREWPGIPADHPRPAVQNLRGASVAFEISVALTSQLKALARRTDTTAYVVLLATFKAFLFQLAKSEDVLVGTPVFGRSKAEFMRIIGDFVNSVPLRTGLNAAMSFHDAVAQVRQTVSEALDAQQFPLTLLVQRLQPERQAGRSPLFDTFFIYQRFDEFKEIEELLTGGELDEPVEIGALLLAAYPFNQQEGQFDLTLKLCERRDKFLGAFSYSTDLFEKSTIKKLVGDYLTLVGELVNNPDRPLGVNTKPAREDTVTDKDSILKLLDQFRSQKKIEVAKLIAKFRNVGLHFAVESGRLKVNAPKGMLDDRIKSSIAARRNEIIAAITDHLADAADVPAPLLRCIDRTPPLALSAVQRRFWFIDRFEQGRGEHNVGITLRLEGEANFQALIDALEFVVERHESLRMRIGERDAEPFPEIMSSSHGLVKSVDLSESPLEDREGEALRLSRAAMDTKFDLVEGPLTTLLLVRISSRVHLLTINMHHIVADGWSLSIAFRDFGARYSVLTGKKIRRANSTPNTICRLCSVGKRASPQGLVRSADELLEIKARRRADLA